MNDASYRQAEQQDVTGTYICTTHVSLVSGSCKEQMGILVDTLVSLPECTVTLQDYFH